jgi:MFS family permease
MTTQEPVAQRPLRAILVTWSVQTLTSVAQSVPIVLAPIAAIHFGAKPEHIGYFVGAVYFAAMTSGLLLSSTINRLGPVRVSQFGLVACCVGLAGLLSSQLVLVLICGLLIGTGYGLSNPTAALILGKHSPVHRRGLFFSIKQTSVPMGVAIAGLLVPAVLGLGGWMTPLIFAAMVCVICVLLLEASVRVLDPALITAVDSSNDSAAWYERFVRPMQIVYERKPVWRIGLVSFAYAAIQSSFLTFLVVYLVLSIELSVTLSAWILACAQGASIVGRPLWGWVADRCGRPAWVLAALGVAMSVAVMLLGSLTPSSPLAWAFFVALLTAATAVAWNGVFYAELVRHADPSELASVTGGVQFLTFGGAMVGPVAFSGVITISGSYFIGFGFLALIGFCAGVSLMLAGRANQPRTDSIADG